MTFSTALSPVTQAKPPNLKSVKFRASSKPDALEIIPNRPDEIKKDPLPRWGMRNVRNLLFSIVGFTGVYYGAPVLSQAHYNFYHPSEPISCVLEKPYSYMVDTELIALVEEYNKKAKLDSSVGLRLNEKDHEAYLEKLKQIEIKNGPACALAPEYAPPSFSERLGKQIIRLFSAVNLALFSLAPLVAGFKKTIRPEELFAELHEQGITGEGVKVGLLDLGYRGHLFEAIDFYYGDDLSKPSRLINPKKEDGHADLSLETIRGGSPDSRFALIDISSKTKVKSKKEKKEAKAEERAFIDKVFTIASKEKGITKAVSLFKKEMFEGFFEASVRQEKRLGKLLDEGADVINISLGLTIPLYFESAQSKVYFKILWLNKLKFISFGKFSESLEEEIKKWDKFASVLQKTAEELNEPEVLAKLMEPLLRAFDKAHEKGSVVVLSAGNSGRAGSNRGNVSVLGAFEHPALILVGSSTIKGKVSKFTSEWTDELMPFNAAYGDGEILTPGLWHHSENHKSYKGFSIPMHKTYNGERLLKKIGSVLSFPILKLSGFFLGGVYSGTSCSGPIESSICALMKSVDLDERIDGPLIKQAIANTTTEASFTLLEEMAVRAQVMGKLDFSLSKADIKLVDAEMAKAIRRRVGHGKLNGVAAVNELKRLLEERKQAG